MHPGCVLDNEDDIGGEIFMVEYATLVVGKHESTLVVGENK